MSRATRGVAAAAAVAVALVLTACQPTEVSKQAIVMTGVDPILVTELSVIFSVVALPLTYLPILLVANDRAYMGDHRNGVVANAFGLFYLVVVLVIAVAAIPLLVLSNMGRG